VLRRQRLIIHQPGQQYVFPQASSQGDGSTKPNGFIALSAKIRTMKFNMRGLIRNSYALENVRQRTAAPSAVADRVIPPIDFVRHGFDQLGTVSPVAGALQSRSQRVTWKLPQVSQGKLGRSTDQAAHRQAIFSSFDPWYFAVGSQEKVFVCGDEIFDQAIRWWTSVFGVGLVKTKSALF
jgi:hypothetical protein